MKRKKLFVLILLCVVIISICIAFWIVIIPKLLPINIEVTVGQSVNQRIGASYYTFKLYPYPEEELTGIYLLRVEKGKDFETKVVVSGHTYNFLDLEIHVVKLIPSGVLLEVKLS